MWTIQTFAKSSGKKPGDIAGQSLTLILRPPEGGPAETGDHSASNLSLTWYPIRHECQTNLQKNFILFYFILFIFHIWN